MVTRGAMALRSMLMRSAMKVEVSSFVLIRLRSYFSAISTSSGMVSMPWQSMIADRSKRMKRSRASARWLGSRLSRYVHSTRPMSCSRLGSK